jgi:hypothetical protein
VVFAIPALSPGTPIGVSPAAAATMRHASRAAAVEESLPDGKYLYTNSTVIGLDLVQSQGQAVGGDVRTATEQTWVSNTGAGRLLTSVTAIQPYPADSTPASPSPLPRPIDLSLGATSGEALPYVVNPSGWPTEPGALKSAIVQRLEDGDTDSYGIFLSTSYLLAETGDPALRSACYQLLAGLPGLTDDGPVTDSIGRSAQAVGITYRGLHSELLIDTSNYQLLEINNTVAAPGQSDVPAYRDLPTGTVLNSKTITSRGVSDSNNTAP